MAQNKRVKTIIITVIIIKSISTYLQFMKELENLANVKLIEYI